MIKFIQFIIFAVVFGTSPFLIADGNVEPNKLKFSLTRNNRANVVRLKNDNGIVRYILEVYLDGWEIDGPDEQLGGSLCLRINRAGGKYLPGCLLCKPDAIKTYSPSDCYGIFTKDLLESNFDKAKRGDLIHFEGVGMHLIMKITKLEFSEEHLAGNGQPKVKALDFEIEIIPDKKVPIAGTITIK